MRFVFDGEQVKMTGADEGPDVMTYEVYPAQQPAAIDFADEQATILAIYKIDRDTLTIALRPRTAKEGSRPTTFDLQPGSEVSVIVLKRR